MWRRSVERVLPWVRWFRSSLMWVCQYQVGIEIEKFLRQKVLGQVWFGCFFKHFFENSSHILREMIQIDYNKFQKGWNHCGRSSLLEKCGWKEKGMLLLEMEKVGVNHGKSYIHDFKNQKKGKKGHIIYGICSKGEFPEINPGWWIVRIWMNFTVSGKKR